MIHFRLTIVTFTSFHKAFHCNELLDQVLLEVINTATWVKFVPDEIELFLQWLNNSGRRMFNQLAPRPHTLLSTSLTSGMLPTKGLNMKKVADRGTQKLYELPASLSTSFQALLFLPVIPCLFPSCLLL